MVVWEIENHGTRERGYFDAIGIDQVHTVLLSKGYSCLIQYELYAGFDEIGNEISIMPAMFNDVTSVKQASGC